MTDRQPFPPGEVVWSGENPGMYLKETQDGPFTGLASFFRVDTSPHGSGIGVVLMEAPETAASTPEALNVCVSDNEPLARWLVAEFISTFGTFKGRPGLGALAYHALTGHTTRNEMPRSYGEDVQAEGIDIRLSWSGLSAPFMVDMPPNLRTTGKHGMYSLFVDCSEAEAVVNGRALKGRSWPRDFQGRSSTTAFLAFAETWVLG